MLSRPFQLREFRFPGSAKGQILGSRQGADLVAVESEHGRLTGYPSTIGLRKSCRPSAQNWSSFASALLFRSVDVTAKWQGVCVVEGVDT